MERVAVVVAIAVDDTLFEVPFRGCAGEMSLLTCCKDCICSGQ